MSAFGRAEFLGLLLPSHEEVRKMTEEQLWLVLSSPHSSLPNCFVPIFKKHTNNPCVPLQKHSGLCASEASPQNQSANKTEDSF